MPRNVDSAVLAAAGPVEGGRCALTNASWVLETEELKRTFRLRTVNIVNDLEALAWAIPEFTPADVRSIGHHYAVAAQPVAVIAPGTGLGMACFVPAGEGASVMASEGGHATLAASDEREAALIEILRRRFGHVSAERVLSGGGLLNLYAALGDWQAAATNCIRRGRSLVPPSMDSSPRAREALNAFCAFLGSVAGNVALMFRARGGVFIAGGIVPRIVDYLPRTDFRARFESKGRFSRYLASIPTGVIVRPDPTFLGLKALAERTCGDAPRADGAADDR